MRFVILAAMIAGILLRLVHLDADPDYYEWLGYLTDEGRWVFHARELALFHQVSLEWPLHLHLAPLFQALTAAIFALFGVSMWSARILTACAGGAVLVTFWWFLRRRATGAALLLGIVLLAFETDLVFLSRVAVPEMVVIWLQLLVFITLVSQHRTLRRAALGGLLLFLAVGMKATALPMLGIFGLVALAIPSGEGESRLGRVAAFVSGFAAPGVLLVLVALASASGSSGMVSSSWNTVRSVLHLASLHESVDFPFDSSLAPLFAMWGLGLWVSLLGWRCAAGISRGDDDGERQSRRILIGAVTWIASYAVLMLGLDYFPSRYKIHILIPIAIAITVGLSLLERVGAATAEEVLGRRDGDGGWLVSTALALPSAVMLAPLLVAGLGTLGVETDHIRVKILAVVASAALVTVVLHARRAGRVSLMMVVLWPLIGLAAWTLTRRTGLNGSHFWPVQDFARYAAWWVSVVFAAAALATLAAIGLRRAGMRAVGGAITVAALGYVLLAGLRLGPALVEPHYTIRDTSRDLGRVFANVPGVGTVKAEGLFNDNRLRYRSIRLTAHRQAHPDVLVTVFPFSDTAAVLQRDYCLLKSYTLYVSAEYLRAMGESGTVARVWGHRSAGACPDQRQEPRPAPPAPSPR